MDGDVRPRKDSGVTGRADGGLRWDASRAPGLFLLLLCLYKCKEIYISSQMELTGNELTEAGLGTDASQVRAPWYVFWTT